MHESGHIGCDALACPGRAVPGSERLQVAMGLSYGGCWSFSMQVKPHRSIAAVGLNRASSVHLLEGVPHMTAATSQSAEESPQQKPLICTSFSMQASL